jgi:hypothetical protein
LPGGVSMLSPYEYPAPGNETTMADNKTTMADDETTMADDETRSPNRQYPVHAG